MRLILVRHGQTPANVDGILESTVPGPGLTSQGDDEASVLPSTFEDEPIEAIFASTQIRSQLTAEPLAGALGLEIQVRDGLREIDAGDLEGLRDRPSVYTYVQTFLSWIDGDLSVRMPGAEDGHEVLGRFDEVLAEIEELGHATVAIVSHGAIIRAWLGTHTDDLEPGFFREHFVANTGYAIVEGSSAGGWRLESWNGGGVFDEALHEDDESPASETVEDE
jgi:broad specificity phosphatase PhoE